MQSRRRRLKRALEVCLWQAPCVFAVLLGVVVLTSPQLAAAGQTVSRADERLQLAVDALQRLKGTDLESNPTVKAAVMKILQRTEDTPHFVELVRDFKIKGQGPALLRYAVRHPEDAAAAEAIRLIIADSDLALIHNALNTADAAPLLRALGNVPDKAVAPLLKNVLADKTRNIALRKDAVHALAQTEPGAKMLLEHAASAEGVDDLNAIIAAALRNVRWPGVQARAAALGPAPEARPDAPLPPISELARLKGNAARGAEVFRRETVGCNKCHQVNGEGVEFGPNLSEIGTKLAREAIYEAILDPNAGISFGYEPWQLELRDGEEAFGLLASETADEVAIKAQSGVVSRYKKSDIVKRVQQKTSIMPSGLAQVMSQQDLVDLVEYLASLRKPGSP
jgi:putative heme-binding domain-containing protein